MEVHACNILVMRSFRSRLAHLEGIPAMFLSRARFAFWSRGRYIKPHMRCYSGPALAC